MKKGGVTPDVAGLDKYKRLSLAGSKFRVNRQMRIGLFLQFVALGKLGKVQRPVWKSRTNLPAAASVLKGFLKDPSRQNQAEMSDFGIRTFREEARGLGIPENHWKIILRKYLQKARGLPATVAGLTKFVGTPMGTSGLVNDAMRMGMFLQFVALGHIGDFGDVMGRLAIQRPKNPNLLDRRTKAVINKNFTRSGLDGNGNFRKPELGLQKALHLLGEVGIDPDGPENNHVFSKPLGSKEHDGRLTMGLAFHNAQDSFSPISITNSMLVLSFHLRESGNYEVLAYLS